ELPFVLVAPLGDRNVRLRFRASELNRHAPILTRMSDSRWAEDRERMVIFEQALGLEPQDGALDLEALALEFACPDDRTSLFPLANHTRHRHVLHDRLGIHERIPNLRPRSVDRHRRMSHEGIRHLNLHPIAEAPASGPRSRLARCPYREDPGRRMAVGRPDLQ